MYFIDYIYEGMQTQIGGIPKLIKWNIHKILKHKKNAFFIEKKND